MSGVLLSMNLGWTEVVDFSVPLYVDQINVIYRRPYIASHLDGFLRPYTAEVRIKKV